MDYIYDLGNVYVFMHMSMHEVNRPVTVPLNHRVSVLNTHGMMILVEMRVIGEAKLSKAQFSGSFQQQTVFRYQHIPSKV
jgi:hypothetical protein